LICYDKRKKPRTKTERGFFLPEKWVRFKASAGVEAPVERLEENQATLPNPRIVSKSLQPFKCYHWPSLPDRCRVMQGEFVNTLIDSPAVR